MYPVENPHPLLRYLTPEEVQRVQPACRTERYHSGDRIIEAGDRNRDLLIVEAGMVEVIVPLRDGRDVVVAVLHDNALIGEMNFVLPLRRTATIRAGADTLLQRYDYHALTDLLRVETLIAAKIFASINEAQAAAYIRTVERFLNLEG